MGKLLYLTFFCLSIISCGRLKRKAEQGFHKIGRGVGEVVDGFLILPDRQVKRDITELELYGEWYITEESTRLLNAHMNDYRDWETLSILAEKFTFKQDGYIDAGLTLKYEPISLYKIPIENDSLKLSGTWKLTRNEKFNATGQYKNNLNIGFEYEPNTTLFLDLGIHEAKDKLTLYSYIGDPDNTHYLEYVKKE
jgi:hypothetical protein